eukprot:1956-Heterococcus_DN1.PRE.3
MPSKDHCTRHKLDVTITAIAANRIKCMSLKHRLTFGVILAEAAETAAAAAVAVVSGSKL